MGTDNIKEICPDHLENKFFKAYDRYSAHLTALKNARIDLNNVDLNEFIPPNVISDYCSVVSKICHWAISKHDRPDNFSTLSEISDVIADIEKTPVKINWASYKKIAHININRKLFPRIRAKSKHVRYDMFKTSTGRLSTKKDSFPILTLNKDFRIVVEPHNDLLIEMDYNAAEIRTLMYLMGLEQPKYDIHDYMMKNVFDSRATRESSKRRLFSWLYDSNKVDERLDKFFPRKEILDKFFDGKKIITPMNRQIMCDEYHALNYLIQSSSSDMVLHQVAKISDILKNRKSRVYFTMHDSFVIDFCNKDKDLIPKLFKTFSNTPFGEYRVNISMGNNFSEMRKIS
tara:strand:+ start:666 stop:1697 length:1032 start_codon:yes stop_codon:yes gene_type:complete